MSDERFDDDLRRRLHGAAAGDGAPRDSLDALRPRFERARRRRSTAVAGGSTVAVAIVVVGALSLGGTSADQRVQVADSSVVPRSSTTTTTTALPRVSVAPTPTAPTSVPPTTAAPVPTTVPAPAGPVPSTVTSAPPAGPAGPATSPTPAPTTAAPGQQRVLASDGGTATVTWTAASIVVDRTDPAAGWTLESVEQKDPTRVVVRFRRDGGGSGSSTATIDARVDGGELRVN